MKMAISSSKAKKSVISTQATILSSITSTVLNSLMIAIGIDIGGTSIKGAAVDSNGKVYESFVMPFVKEDSGEKIIRDLAELVKKYIKEQGLEGKIAGMGIGCPGSIDIEKGVVNYANNLGWNNLLIAKIMQETLPYPVRLINDANAAALGEAKFGSGSKYLNSIMITLGTGIGGGVIINGKLYDGYKHQGGELGHMVIHVNGRVCGCGRKGCFEAYASASALIKDTRAMMKKHPESLLTQIEKELVGVDGRNAFLAAKRGDKYGMKLVNDYVMYLSEGIMSICNSFRPDIIVLSGGVANEGEYLINKTPCRLKDIQQLFISTGVGKDGYSIIGQGKVEGLFVFTNHLND